MSNWQNGFPSVQTKNDLEGKTLTSLETKPPEKASKAGLWELYVCVHDENMKVTDAALILVTTRDLAKIAEAHRGKKFFTFVRKDGAEWCEVGILDKV